MGEGDGNPLWCSCLENPRDGGAWWAAAYGVAQSRTRLKRLSSSSSRVVSCFKHPSAGKHLDPQNLNTPSSIMISSVRNKGKFLKSKFIQIFEIKMTDKNWSWGPYENICLYYDHGDSGNISHRIANGMLWGRLNLTHSSSPTPFRHKTWNPQFDTTPVKW